MVFYIQASNFKQAEKRAARTVKKMLGGDSCLEILFIEQTS